MIDPFGRAITYLRVSVTDRCDLRCVYCMAEDMTFLPKAEILSLEEIDRLCGAFIRLGTTKIRITGGEPLVRRNVMTLFRSLGERLGAGLEPRNVKRRRGARQRLSYATRGRSGNHLGRHGIQSTGGTRQLRARGARL